MYASTKGINSRTSAEPLRPRTETPCNTDTDTYILLRSGHPSLSPCHYLRDSMSNNNSRLLRLLLSQPRCNAHFEGSSRLPVLISRSSADGYRETFQSGNQDAVGNTLQQVSIIDKEMSVRLSPYLVDYVLEQLVLVLNGEILGSDNFGLQNE